MELPTFALPKKPTYVKFAEDIDFFTLFKKIERYYETCFVLESLGEQTSTSRYSVIGFAPDHVIRAKGTKFFIDGKSYPVENPYQALQELMPEPTISRNYAGGLVGFLGYDAVSYFESGLKIRLHEDYDQFMFGFYTDGLVYDTLTNEVFYFYYTNDRRRELEQVMDQPLEPTSVKVHFKGASMTQAEHASLVEAIKEEVITGNTFQCQLGFKHDYTITGDKVLVYENLRSLNPSPYMYYVKFEDTAIIGSSPELLFRLRQGEMETFPLAGTIRRGQTDDEDRALARTLVNDYKEQAEHKMLVDLHRNDIGRVAQFGTVKVRRYMDIKKFSHVQHISSEIAGIMKKGETMFSGLAAQFPAGTLSGAPKIESMKIIERCEKTPRGPYGGAIGHFGFNGDCTFAIPIRTLFCKGDEAFTQAAGGIVYDSIAANEYDEIQRKMRAVTMALEKFL